MINECRDNSNNRPPGSKGVPRKNIRILVGKPFIAWTIKAAVIYVSLDRVIVFTGGQHIVKNSRALRNRSIFPAKLNINIKKIFLHKYYNHIFLERPTVNYDKELEVEEWLLRRVGKENKTYFEEFIVYCNR